MALDLRKLDSDAGGEWNGLTETPVGVRANAAVGLNGKLWVLGGLADNGDTTRRVDVYDPSTDTWTSGPELPASGSLNGFGADAVTVNGGRGRHFERRPIRCPLHHPTPARQ